MKTKPTQSPSLRFRVQPYKYLGKTDNYAGFLKTRRELDKKYMLHQPLVQKIIKGCVTTLPEKLFDIGVLRNKPYELKELEQTFSHLLEDAKALLYKFYCRIAEMVEFDDTKLDSVTYGRLLKVSICLQNTGTYKLIFFPITTMPINIIYIYI